MAWMEEELEKEREKATEFQLGLDIAWKRQEKELANKGRQAELRASDECGGISVGG